MMIKLTTCKARFIKLGYRVHVTGKPLTVMGVRYFDNSVKLTLCSDDDVYSFRYFPKDMDLVVEYV